jgi:excisionase family DNA binding protein
MRELWKPPACLGYLGVSRTVLYELMRRPVDPLPFLRIGQRRRFDPEAVQAWATRQRSNLDATGQSSRKPTRRRVDTPIIDGLIESVSTRRRRAGV